MAANFKNENGELRRLRAHPLTGSDSDFVACDIADIDRRPEIAGIANCNHEFNRGLGVQGPADADILREAVLHGYPLLGQMVYEARSKGKKNSIIYLYSIMLYETWSLLM